MCNEEKTEGASWGAAPSVEIKTERASLYPQNPFPQKQNDQNFNSYTVTNSRFIKREDRDPRLFLSPKNDDYLVSMRDSDLVEKLKREFSLVKTFDQLAN